VGLDLDPPRVRRMERRRRVDEGRDERADWAVGGETRRRSGGWSGAEVGRGRTWTLDKQTLASRIYMTLAIGSLVGYLAFKIYCDGHDRLPAAVNRFTASSKSVRRG
jgi:hypothetical protein